MTNLEKVLYYTKDLESPEHFIVWDYLYIIASCLGRRVWLQDVDFAVFPNVYIIIVGPPAVGKSLPAVKLGALAKALHDLGPDGKTPIPSVTIAPDCVTLEALYYCIANATKLVRNPKDASDIYAHASVSFMLGDEMGVLFKDKASTGDLVMFLIKGYECGDFHYKTLRNGEAEIKNMCINFFGCCTPAWMTKNLSSAIIEEGMASRAIFLWGDTPRQITTFIRIGEEQKKAINDVKSHFRALTKLYGPVSFTPEAEKLVDEWNQDRVARRINNDRRLDYYYGRKKIHLFKVAMLVHFSEKTTMIIEAEDVSKAMTLLYNAELDMHRALNVNSRNPLNLLSSKIKGILEEHEKKNPKNISFNEKILVGMLWEHGDMDEITKAWDYLKLTNQIIHDGTGFRLVKN